MSIHDDIKTHGDWSERFSPGRYPYTYAYDFAREFPGVIGVDAADEAVGSRALMAAEVERYCIETNQKKKDVVAALADAYLARWHIAKP